MDIKRLKKVLAGFSIVSLVAGSGLTFTGCATTSCSGTEKEGSQTSCSGKTSCSGTTSCSGEKSKTSCS